MRRREFITLIGGAAAAWPLAARAQQPAMPVIGFLSGRSQEESTGDAAAFRQGLNEMGYVAGRNVELEYRWAEGRNERLPELAADLVRRGVVAIAAVGGNNSAFAARAATATIPIVFTSGADPVKVGLVASLNRPGGLVTGVSWFAAESVSKLLEVLGKLVPNIARAVLLLNPYSPELAGQPEMAQQAARALGWQLQFIEARSENEIDTAFADAKRQRADAVIVSTDPFFRNRHEQIVARAALAIEVMDVRNVEEIAGAFAAIRHGPTALVTLADGVTISNRKQIVELAAKHRLPAIYQVRAFVDAGGLMSYGLNFCQHFRRGARYVDRILKGAKPADLPVELPTTFELIINRIAANAIGVAISESFLMRADEVIE